MLVAALATPCGLSGTAQAAPKETVLHSFTYMKGEFPTSGLLADGAGNLYGTTTQGGSNNDGLVFELTPPTTGKKAWTETVLFTFDGTNGKTPVGGLLADAAGNVYGATATGGEYSGVVFKLSPPKAGRKTWTETVLSAAIGGDAGSGLLADAEGNLYGTTYTGADYGVGGVFELSPPKAGQTEWSWTSLFSFNESDGGNPLGGLLADGAGNLYGTTFNGGVKGDGVVFELSPPKAGQTTWAETVLFAFAGNNGSGPAAGLIVDGAGNLYGTTYNGGVNNGGVVFELSPPVAGETVWTETVLYRFRGGAAGNYPAAGLLADGAGNLYGTTSAGGVNPGNTNNNDGVVFELSPPKAGQTAWTETVLFTFAGKNGAAPNAGLIVDGAGNFYGTTTNGGGVQEDGVVFKLTP